MIIKILQRNLKLAMGGILFSILFLAIGKTTNANNELMMFCGKLLLVVWVVWTLTIGLENIKKD